MTQFEVVTGREVDSSESAAFLRRMFPATKSRAIIEHGDWIYHGLENQWFATSDKQIAGYCAIIPVDCAVNGSRVPALWWVDLIVDPAFRGQGVQSLFDAKIRAVADLKLGFPNELAAQIHRKHQWGVREDGDVFLLPLRPTRNKKVTESSGPTGLVLRVLALSLKPAAMLWRYRIQLGGRSNNAIHYQRPDPELLGDLFERYKTQYPATTYRDAAYWRWRYLEAPYARELHFYTAGPSNRPSHCLVTRVFDTNGPRVMRLLDWFGNRDDKEGLREMLFRSLAEAIRLDVDQVTVMDFSNNMRPFWRKLGFVARTPGRFCWHSQDPALMNDIALGNHWMLGDSDNDATE